MVVGMRVRMTAGVGVFVVMMIVPVFVAVRLPPMGFVEMDVGAVAARVFMHDE